MSGSGSAITLLWPTKPKRDESEGSRAEDGRPWAPSNRPAADFSAQPAQILCPNWRAAAGEPPCHSQASGTAADGPRIDAAITIAPATNTAAEIWNATA